jgi:hypothetical protein
LTKGRVQPKSAFFFGNNLAAFVDNGKDKCSDERNETPPLLEKSLTSKIGRLRPAPLAIQGIVTSVVQRGRSESPTSSPKMLTNKHGLSEVDGRSVPKGTDAASTLNRLRQIVASRKLINVMPITKKIEGKSSRREADLHEHKNADKSDFNEHFVKDKLSSWVFSSRPEIEKRFDNFVDVLVPMRFVASSQNDPHSFPHLFVLNGVIG